MGSIKEEESFSPILVLRNKTYTEHGECFRYKKGIILTPTYL